MPIRGAARRQAGAAHSPETTLRDDSIGGEQVHAEEARCGVCLRGRLTSNNLVVLEGHGGLSVSGGKGMQVKIKKLATQL